MKNLLIHGLGQDKNAWNIVKNELNMKGISSSAPDLFAIAKGKELDYNTVYQAFSRLCDSHQDRLNLCGLSLGGLLALNYAIEHAHYDIRSNDDYFLCSLQHCCEYLSIPSCAQNI